MLHEKHKDRRNILSKELAIEFYTTLYLILMLYLILALVHPFLNRKVVPKFFRVSYRACNM